MYIKLSPSQIGNTCSSFFISFIANTPIPSIGTYGFINQNKRFCAKHKLKNMIDLSHLMCIHENCELRANYGFKNSKAEYCAKHKEEKMLDLTHSLCLINECINRSSYGKPGNKMTHCYKHKEPGMIKSSNARCLELNCKNYAIFGLDKRLLHCELHKKENEINLIEQKCISCGLTMILDSNNKCEYCNPESFKTFRLAKQNNLMNYLDSIGLNGTSTDIIINNGECGLERPDRIYEKDDFILILECDKNQHKERQCFCEQIRMINVAQSFGGIPVYFIRWNPDIYKREDNNYESINKRYELVGNLIKSILNKRTLLPKDSLVSALYMFYDGWNGLLNEEWKSILKLELCQESNINNSIKKYNKLYDKIKNKKIYDFL
jgi:hypothetical protein